MSIDSIRATPGDEPKPTDGGGMKIVTKRARKCLRAEEWAALSGV